MQLRFDVYFIINNEHTELTIYRLVPRITQYKVTGKPESIDTFMDLLKKLEIGGLAKIDFDSPDKLRFCSFLSDNHLLCEDRNAASLDSPYLRQMEMFESWDTRDIPPEVYQQRLGSSSVLVIGAGGLGTPIINMLSHAGVGHIVIADNDTVERTNLSRQYLYRPSDIGRPKVDVAAERINESQLGTVIPLNMWINSGNVLDVIEQHRINIVTGINVTDLPEVMGTIHAVLTARVPVLCVSEHSVGPFLFTSEDVDRTENFLSQFTLRDQYLQKRQVVKKREMHPSMVTDLAMVGALCSNDIIRFLSGISEPCLVNAAYGFDTVNCVFHAHSLDEKW